jgi:L-2,4-diaminobutyrate decarboxylase
MNAKEQFFLGTQAEATASLGEVTQVMLEMLRRSEGYAQKPFSGITPGALQKLVQDLPRPENHGKNLAAVLADVVAPIVQHSINPSHPLCLAHLHCPPALPSIAADLVISALNQSMDSWDQASAATELEQVIVQWLVEQTGYDPGADGVFTSGGTMSNHMGVLLARECAARAMGLQVMEDGFGAAVRNFRILCSDRAHFSVAQAAGLSGFGRKAVVPVKTNDKMQLDPEHLQQTIAALQEQGLKPMMVVATAGTTSFGSLDPLAAIAGICRRHGIWLHVDAAYGFALLFSERHAERLSGLSEADSITCDFHKLFYQPIACGAFLVRDKKNLEVLMTESDYLDRESDRALGYSNLVGKSLQTTRRFDALKIWVFLQNIGMKDFGGWIDHTIAMTEVAAALATRYGFKLAVAKPELNTLAFRVEPEASDDPAVQKRVCHLQQAIRLDLMHAGFAVIGQTELSGKFYLKLTMLHPQLTTAHLERLFGTIAERSLTLWKQ